MSAKRWLSDEEFLRVQKWGWYKTETKKVRQSQGETRLRII